MMPIEPLLHLWTSVLKRLLHSNLYIRLPFKGLLWLISLLRRIIRLGRRTLTSRDWRSAGSSQTTYPDSYFCASLQPPPEAETGYSLELLPISTSSSGTLAQSSDPSLSEPHDPNPFPESQPTTPGAPTPTPETSVSNGGSMEASRPRPHLCEEVKNLLAVSPTEFERYDRNETVEEETKPAFTVPPLTRSLPPLAPPPGWKAFTHPEGARYFYHPTKRILTDVYLHIEERHLQLEGCINQIQNYLTHYDVPWEEQTVLVLETRNDRKIGYYFVDHAYQSIFWLDPFRFLELDELSVEFSGSHVGLQMLSQYWYHNNLFPDVFAISPDAISQLKDMLIYSISDVLTSDSSTVPLAPDTLQKMLDLVERMQHRQAIDEQYQSGAVCTLSRLMVTFVDQKFTNLHGERAARLNSGQSVLKPKQPTWLIKILSPAFLFAPGVYLQRLHKVSIDHVVNHRNWKEMVSQLTEEWKEFTLLATVLLTTNVSFLAIQSVDKSPVTIAQQASYVSALSSMGSIVLGLLLGRQHRTTLDANFVTRRAVSRLGLETLALMYSLPFTLLVWGMISFLLSFSFMCYTTRNALTYILVSSAWMWLAMFIFWCISVQFERQPYYHLLPARIWHALRDKFRKRVGNHGEVDAEQGVLRCFSVVW